jgi:hypothetical protein
MQHFFRSFGYNGAEIFYTQREIMTTNPYRLPLVILITVGFSACTPTLPQTPPSHRDSYPSNNSTNDEQSDYSEYSDNEMSSTSFDSQESDQLQTQQPSTYHALDPEKEEIFQKRMHSIGLKIKEDDAYERIDFASKEEKAWFKGLTYRLWDRQITRQEFLETALQKYPQHKYEFEFIIRHFTY